MRLYEAILNLAPIHLKVKWEAANDVHAFDMMIVIGPSENSQK